MIARLRQLWSNPNKRVGMLAAGLGVSMFALAFISAPLYDLFCRTTGFFGATQIAKTAPATASNQTVEVRFDANVAQGLPWRFEPEQAKMTVRLGEPNTAVYKVTNTSNRDITALASYNVTPGEAGLFFNKIQCFCFTEQTVKAGQTEELSVVFFVDPAMLKDDDSKSIDTITLSYTFFGQKKEAKPFADRGNPVTSPEGGRDTPSTRIN